MKTKGFQEKIFIIVFVCLFAFNAFAENNTPTSSLTTSSSPTVSVNNSSSTSNAKVSSNPTSQPFQMASGPLFQAQSVSGASQGYQTLSNAVTSLMGVPASKIFEMHRLKDWSCTTGSSNDITKGCSGHVIFQVLNDDRTRTQFKVQATNRFTSDTYIVSNTEETETYVPVSMCTFNSIGNRADNCQKGVDWVQASSVTTVNMKVPVTVKKKIESGISSVTGNPNPQIINSEKISNASNLTKIWFIDSTSSRLKAQPPKATVSLMQSIFKGLKAFPVTNTSYIGNVLMSKIKNVRFNLKNCNTTSGYPLCTGEMTFDYAAQNVDRKSRSFRANMNVRALPDGGETFSMYSISETWLPADAPHERVLRDAIAIAVDVPQTTVVRTYIYNDRCLIDRVEKEVCTGVVAFEVMPDGKNIISYIGRYMRTIHADGTASYSLSDIRQQTILMN